MPVGFEVGAGDGGTNFVGLGLGLVVGVPVKPTASQLNSATQSAHLSSGNECEQQNACASGQTVQASFEQESAPPILVG